MGSFLLWHDKHAKSRKAIAVKLRNNLKACVFLEGFRDANALWGLMVFEQCGHDSGQGEGAAVEGVHELDVAVLVLVAELQAVGLEGLKVGY